MLPADQKKLQVLSGRKDDLKNSAIDEGSTQFINEALSICNMKDEKTPKVVDKMVGVGLKANISLGRSMDTTLRSDGSVEKMGKKAHNFIQFGVEGSSRAPLCQGFYDPVTREAGYAADVGAVVTLVIVESIAHLKRHLQGPTSGREENLSRLQLNQIWK